MGRIARALSVIENKIKARSNASDVNESEHLQPLGDDSKPLPQDDGWSDRTNENGGDIYLGAFDYENKVTEPGEKRIYGRDADGNAVNQVYLKKDGAIVISNDSYSKTINPDGSFTETNGVYELLVDADGSFIELNEFYSKRVNDDGSFIEINGGYTKEVGEDGSFTESNDTYSKSVSDDGSFTETNGAYTKTVATSGEVNINGFVIGPDGSASSPVSVTAPNIEGTSSVIVAGKELKDHKHAAGEYKDAEKRPLTGESGPQS